MRHNAIKTFDGKAAATTDQIPAAVTRIGHARPVDAGNLHLQIQTATAPDFSDAVTAIDTYANAGDRAKVLLFDGSGFVAIAEGGAGASFGGQSVLADVASIEPLQYVRLRWFEALEPVRYLAWDGRYFPASGGGGGASSAAASATGTLIVNITGVETGTGWNTDNSDTWYVSGRAVNLPPGSHTILFKQTGDYAPPPPKPVTIYAGSVTEMSVEYPTGSDGNVDFSVTITGPDSARWSYNNGLTWIPSSYDDVRIPPGDYTVTFKAVAGYDTPSNQSVTAEFGTPVVLTATYAAAGSGATGYSAYLVGGTEPELISAAADPTKCVGGDYTLNVINGGLFWYNQRIGADSDWASCSGGEGSIGAGTWGYGIKTAGTLHAISATGNVSQIGVATNWAAVSGLSGGYLTAYARTSAGELYALQGATAAKIGASTTWETVSGWSYLYSTTIKNAAIAIDAGKLIRLDADTPTQIGAATNWAAVGPVLNGVCLAKNDLGELFVVTATLETTAVLQVGASTDWDKLSRVHATNTAGELYSINTTTATATQVGVASNWSALAGSADITASYALNTAGELRIIKGVISMLVGGASDWMKLGGNVRLIAVRGTAM